MWEDRLFGTVGNSGWSRIRVGEVGKEEEEGCSCLEFRAGLLFGFAGIAARVEKTDR